MVEHYGDGYAGVQELAAGANYTWAGHNSATLTYFATEVYAFDVAIPGEGCVGKAAASPMVDSHGGSASAASATVTAAPLTSVAATRTVLAVSSTATSAAPAVSAPGSECHTHDDGTLHCV